MRIPDERKWRAVLSGTEVDVLISRKIELLEHFKIVERDGTVEQIAAHWNLRMDQAESRYRRALDRLCSGFSQRKRAVQTETA